VVGKKEKYLVAAQKFIERGQLDKALAEFARVVEEDPKDTRTWLKMAELHAKRGANGDATDIYLRTGDLYAEQGFAQKAVAVYKNVLKLSPGTVPAHLKLAALYKQLGLLQDAVQQFEQASSALERNQKLVDAVAPLRQAMEIQPDNVVLRVKLAEAASQAGLTDEAVREFARSADQLKAQGRGDESLRVVERLLFHQPDNYAKARELAEAYIARGSPRLALPKLQACLNGDPRSTRTLSLLAQALEQLGQLPKAVSVIKELVRLCDDLGRTGERDAAVLRGLGLDPNDGELRGLAARHQLRGHAAVAPEARTPPPPVSAVSDTGSGGVELGGAERFGAGGTGVSGRVAVPVGFGEGSGPGIGISLPAAADIERMMAETEVFVKYGLLERAVDHLDRIFEVDANYRPAREKMISVLKRLGRHDDATRQAALLDEQAALSMRPPRPRSIALDVDVPIDVDSGVEVQVHDDDDDDPAAQMATPPPMVGGLGLDAGSESDDEAPLTPPPRSLSTDFDVEVKTGDVVLSDMEFEVSSGAIAHASLEVDDDEEEVTIGRAAAPISRNLDVDDEAAAQITPPPESPAGHPPADERMTVTLDQDDDEDPAAAFREAEATVASAGFEHLAAMSTPPPAATEEDELSEELNQVAFFIEQSLTDDARALLKDLEARFPGHPRLVVKLRELQAAEARLDARIVKASGRSASGRTQATPGAQGAPQASAIVPGPRGAGATLPPRAVVDGGDSDYATHADLAIAYKEMGLFDAAIGELKQLAADPGHEVFALTTMGECYEAKGTFTEAILRYKRALNCEQITTEERLILYYLLGTAFDRLGDVSEALYFFEMVAKRSPRFRDVERRVAELRPRMVKRAR
jgi:pilus assembly protein FimV